MVEEKPQKRGSESSHWRTAESKFCSLFNLSLRNQSHNLPAFNSSMEHSSSSAITLSKFRDDIYTNTTNSFNNNWGLRQHVYSKRPETEIIRLNDREIVRACRGRILQPDRLLRWSRKSVFQRRCLIRVVRRGFWRLFCCGIQVWNWA